MGAELVDGRGPGGATCYAYFAGPAWHGTEYYAEHRAFAGVFPTRRGYACVRLCTPTGDARAAVSGHGLSDAFRDAELLAVALDAALRGDADGATALGSYQRRRDGALAEIFAITTALVRAFARELGASLTSPSGTN